MVSIGAVWALVSALLTALVFRMPTHVVFALIDASTLPAAETLGVLPFAVRERQHSFVRSRLRGLVELHVFEEAVLWKIIGQSIGRSVVCLFTSHFIFPSIS